MPVYTFKKNKLFGILFMAATVTGLSACDSNISDAESKKRSSTVATEDTDGVIKGTITSAAGGTLVASPNSLVADAAVVIPAGALAVDTELSMGEAQSASATLVTELGIAETNLLVSESSPVFIGAAAATAVASPMQIYLPLPVDTSSNLSGLGLTKTNVTLASAKLVFLYTVYVDGGYKSGVKALTAANLVGTFVNMEVKGFGYFQIAYFTTAVEEKEVTTLRQPTLKR
jgi:hypothetical protein